MHEYNLYHLNHNDFGIIPLGINTKFSFCKLTNFVFGSHRLLNWSLDYSRILWELFALGSVHLGSALSNLFTSWNQTSEINIFYFLKLQKKTTIKYRRSKTETQIQWKRSKMGNLFSREQPQCSNVECSNKISGTYIVWSFTLQQSIAQFFF